MSRYLWAAPTSALGLLALPLAFPGGKVRVIDGVLEVSGPAVAYLLRLVPIRGGAAAMTLGHVVLGRDHECLCSTRAHERVHVRQCERWGPLFVPAYLAASAWAVFRGGDPYRDNRFEREAFGE